ncbi:MAG: hypothetical protein WDZ93_04005 [Candidatus Paceibacterota bacterium]
MKYLPHNIALIALVMLVTLPFIAAAQETGGFKPLVGIPGVDANASTQDYISALFALSIGVASALAVLRIIMAGVKYMFSEIVTDKTEAKGDIRNALIGLLLILGAVTILNEINPELTKFDIFRNAPAVDVGVNYDTTIGSEIGDTLENTNSRQQNRIFDQNCRGGGGHTSFVGGVATCKPAINQTDQQRQEAEQQNEEEQQNIFNDAGA